MDQGWRWLGLPLAVLLGYLQYRLWSGPGSYGAALMLQAQVNSQSRENEGLRQRNTALVAEVTDLKEGVAAIEERARSELGMIRPNETFYRVVDIPKTPSPVAAPVPALSRPPRKGP